MLSVGHDTFVQPGTFPAGTPHPYLTRLMVPKLYRIHTGNGPDDYFMSDLPLRKMVTGPGPRDFYVSASAPPPVPEVGPTSSGGTPIGNLLHPRTMRDDWARVTNTKDDVTMHIHIQAWNVCCANTAWDDATNSTTKRLSLCTSTQWAFMLHPNDPLATKQRWYCHCGAKYKESW